MSPALSFSGETSRGAFWVQILLELKNQTLRNPRKRPIKVGDLLKLYWKQRLSAHKKPIHLIGEAECIAVDRLLYNSYLVHEDAGRKDGFKDNAELREWLGDPELYGLEPYDVIQWKIDHEAIVTNCKALLKAIKRLKDPNLRLEYLEQYQTVLERNFAKWRKELIL